VGSGVFNLVSRNASEILRKTGSSIEIAQVGCRRDHPDVELGSTNVTRDIFEVARNPDVDVVLELIGGIDRARELLVIALENKKHVVTANKALIATHGDELFALAEKMGVQLRYEAAIAGGIPIVKAIREGLAANRISWLAGIINGTSNFILTEMEQSGSDLAFSEVLKQAQDLGYAEADPTFDIEGIDAAHKLTILSSIAFGVPLEFDAMYTQGISKITTEDIQYADELGYKIRHLGITRRSELGIELRVHPTLIRKEEMLAQVNGVMNAVMVSSDAAGRTMYYGAGAGAGPTASSVVADIIDIVRGQGSPGIANLGFVNEGFVKDKTLPILDIEDITSACYLKLNVIDQPGVMARLTAILSHHKISIEALIQKDAQGGFAAIVIVTDEVVERSMNAAIKELESLDEVRGSVTHIRITDLQD
jgi:homoserine dehydrogenase